MSAAPPIAPDVVWEQLPREMETSAVAPAAINAELAGANQDFYARTAIIVSADAPMRQSLAESLEGLRWRVREASGGAQAMMLLDDVDFEAMILDDWLPDLQVTELAEIVRLSHPRMDVLFLHGRAAGHGEASRNASPRRHELLHAMREAKRHVQDSVNPSWTGGSLEPGDVLPDSVGSPNGKTREPQRVLKHDLVTDGSRRASGRWNVDTEDMRPLPDLVGASRAMREIASLVRMVAPRTTTVLIEGETGTGKEVIARTLHKLSPRANKPFAVLNCAAIPESLLEPELFGHTRGAFTGAVQSRVGRIEAAHGGTLLLDEIGEMPMGMQAKMLRFLESGELQRVGDNEIARVDVRLIAATHQSLEKNATDGTFRLDLYHRLAVFPIEVPPVRERLDDIPALAEHFLEQLSRSGPRKRLREDALARLQQHSWPGNVRELMHVLERALILSGQSVEISAADIRYRRRLRE